MQVIHKKVEEVHLEEKVDVIISEWMGFYLLHESMLDSVLVARDKFLKEDGIMMPSHATIYASPCSLKKLRETTVDFWQNVFGFNMNPLAKEALKRTKPEITTIEVITYYYSVPGVPKIRYRCFQLRFQISVKEFSATILAKQC